MLAIANCIFVHGQTIGFINGHAWVDLGLSVKWATCNVGADNPEDFGFYYAWGEISPKATYDWTTYKWCKGDEKSITKYCNKSEYGVVDNKNTLDLKDDAAFVCWGKEWRMPTDKEQDELLKKCVWTWTTRNGVNGYNVVGLNGNSIFLPASGYRGVTELGESRSGGYYWSSTGGICYAYYIVLDPFGHAWSCFYRYVGRSIRPVTEW